MILGSVLRDVYVCFCIIDFFMYYYELKKKGVTFKLFSSCKLNVWLIDSSFVKFDCKTFFHNIVLDFGNYHHSLSL